MYYKITTLMKARNFKFEFILLNYIIWFLAECFDRSGIDM